jgi:ABC-type transport system substrate-binding protein
LWKLYFHGTVDAWVTFVSNTSLSGNWAGYNNPIVQNCVSEFTSTTNISAVQAACQQAQQQIYNDAPYGWLGVIHPWLPAGGSIVWKTGVIKSFLVDPTFTGDLVEPILNTVIPGP